MDHRSGQGINWYKLTGWGLSLAALGFLGRWLWQVDRSVWVLLKSIQPAWFVLTTVCWLAWFLLRGLAWHRMSRAHGYQAPTWPGIRLWAISELMRYVPGNVWSFAARYGGASKGGVDRVANVQILFLEALSLVSSAGAVTLSFFWPQGGIAISTLSLGLLIFGIPLILGFLLRRFRQPVDQHVNRASFALMLLQHTVAWLLFGLGTWAFFIAFESTAHVAWTRLMAASIGSWLIGYLSLITPMGLGVREVSFVRWTQVSLGLGLATVIATASRVWLIVTEIFFVGLLQFISRTRKTPAQDVTKLK